MEAESPAPVTVLDSAALEAAPGAAIDDRLRLVPGFTLFRRTSSLVANPTTQGVSLRGLGSTGASRTLVLWDGIPLNSPFGGWVYWTRIVPDELDRVEVSESASTSVFGDRAMGGSIALFGRDAAAHAGAGHLGFAYEAGTRGTNDIEASGSYLFHRQWALSATSRDFLTDGWYIVPQSVRGPVDRLAGVAFAAGTLRLDYLGAENRVFLRGDVLAEDRDNGTALQKNSTGTGTLAAGWSRQESSDTWSALGWYTREDFHATFSSINAARTFERLTSTQSVPAESTGGAVFWRHSQSRWNLLSGGDFSRAEGYSHEVFYPGAPTDHGGTLLQGGAFTQADATLGRVRLFAGFRAEDAANGAAFWSPSGGATVGFGRWRFRASANRAFRAPTLNELYRSFRTGNVVTLANAALLPETLAGVESGADWVGERTQLSITLYRNSLGNLITNVTQSATPLLITRQRENTNSALARGVEAKLTRRLGPLRFESAYLLADSRVASGLRVPQVAKQQGTAQLIYDSGANLLEAGVRASGLQFEDDLNAYLLPGYAVWHLTARRTLPRGFSLNLQVENLMNREVVAGYSPTPLVGAPRLIRAGVRWTLP
ncbi:MAG: TonB-dependent receptor [Bryobacteraceae bacterium]|nr:TonB-dependent receptor [Bryobacteraceae bacterium]